MQKQQRNSELKSKARQIVFFACVILVFVVFSASNVIRVKTITFSSADSLEITADEYIVSPYKPYILLFHEQGSSRGEYHTIARRLCKLDYNCLALDLRNGGNNSRVSNETAKRCREVVTGSCDSTWRFRNCVAIETVSSVVTIKRDCGSRCCSKIVTPVIFRIGDG